MDDLFASESTRRRRRLWLAQALVCILLLGSLAWLAAGAAHGPEDPPAAGTDQGSRLPGSGGVTSNTSDTLSRGTHLDRCRQVYDAQLDPLLAASTAMPQWQIHVTAMNQLVLGAITLQQATQFWNQTRVGARRRLRHFSTVVERFDERGVRCLPVGSTAPERLQQCARAVVARNHALAAARRALHTWSVHVTHMEMLRDGMMSPARATRLWLQSWHAGQREIDRYGAAMRDVRADPTPC
jgi:hypothetical protein